QIYLSMKQTRNVLIVMFLALFIAGCTPQNSDGVNNEEEAIVASFYPTGEIAKSIVGNTSQVSVMVPQGADPHSFEPTPRQIQEFSQADVFITMGGILESIEEDIMTTNSQITQIDASHNVELITGEEHDHDKERDSHEEEHNHDEEHNEHHDDEHDNHEENHVEVKFDEEHNELIYHIDVTLPSPCYSIIENTRYEGEQLILEIELESDPDAICAQVIEEVHHEGEIEINSSQDIHEFIIAVDEEIIFEQHLEDIEHNDEEQDHHDEHEHSHEDEHNHDHGEFDPHTWLSIQNMITMSEEIEEKLNELYPQHSQLYSQNAQSYRNELEELQNEFDSTLNSCEKDVIIVNHKAFGYLAQEYGFEQVSVAGFSAESEPSPQSIQRVVDTAREYNLSYVFSEGQFDDSIAQTIAGDIGGEVLELNPLPQERHANYFDMMRENLEQLAIGLECN
ncbi:MAG: metal ABC transporter substrate-binding protein, partial [Candidatus Nanoarchaeia archaeon]